MQEYIVKLENHENLNSDEMRTMMDAIMSGEVADDEIAGFLMALRKKGPTIEEITAAAEMMRQFVCPIEARHPVVLDTCGTGGDKKDTFNISTLAALVVAGAGVIVAKHGNRSVSSQCGSADILEALGVNLTIEEKNLSQCLDEVGIAFLFAQRLHPAMKHVASVRKELGVETIFNVLGPLTNPAKATHQIMGVYRRDLVEPMAEVLKNLGLKRAMVVFGSDGLDEVTTTGTTFVSELNQNQEIESYEINPEELGIALADPKDLIGGDLQCNVDIAKNVLSGAKGPQRDIVLLNAACALYISEVVCDISGGLKMAAESIDSGKAQQRLEALKEFTHSNKT